MIIPFLGTRIPFLGIYKHLEAGFHAGTKKGPDHCCPTYSLRERVEEIVPGPIK
jgi:hypothetical protein